MQYAPMFNGRGNHFLSPGSSTSSQNSYTGGGKLRPQSIAVMGSLSESQAESMDLNSHKPRLFDMRMLAESLEGVGGAYSLHQEAVSLDEALSGLLSALEDCRGHYPELQKLDEQIQNLHKLVEVSLQLFPFFDSALIASCLRFDLKKNQRIMKNYSAFERIKKKQQQNFHVCV